MLSGQAYPAEGFTEAPVTALMLARPAFDRALEIDPDYANAHSGLGIALEALGRVAGREALARIAAHLLDPDPTLRNAAIPVITVIGIQVGVLLGGAIVIEVDQTSLRP